MDYELIHCGSSGCQAPSHLSHSAIPEFGALMCFVILLHEPIPLSIVKSPVLNCYDSLVPGLVESAEVQRSDSRWPSGSIGPGYPR